tara:strand:+ start:2535 stop:3371 length:837 start_codon:yes stop_codon:yes gene_type:complete
MKTPYIYFGQKGYLYELDGDGADQTINGGSTLTIADHGMVPINHTRAEDDPADASQGNDTSIDAYRIVVKAATSAGSTRGSTYTHDFVTGAAFTAGADATATTSEIGDVTELNNSDAFGVSSGVITIVNYATDNPHGYLIGNNDKFWVEQVARHDAAGNGPSGTNLSSAFAYPMTSFLGANPIAYAGEHYDGTALDKTDLYFLKSDGTGTTDTIRLIHTAGKYPDIVKTMEAVMNCGIYNRALTFYDLDINGKETFLGGPSLSGQNDLGIVGCWRTTV